MRVGHRAHFQCADRGRCNTYSPRRRRTNGRTAGGCRREPFPTSCTSKLLPLLRPRNRRDLLMTDPTRPVELLFPCYPRQDYNLTLTHERGKHMDGLQPPQDQARSLVGFPDRCPADPTTVKGSKKV